MATVHLYSAVLFLFCLTEYDRVCVCVCMSWDERCRVGGDSI